MLPFGYNTMSIRSALVDAFYSLGRDVNKRRGDAAQETAEGVVGPRLPELELDMSEGDLVTLANAWERAWNDSDAKQKWEKQGDENEKYWRGEQFDRPAVANTRPDVDNVIFEGLETYLPQVTRRNPEPMVQLAQGEDRSPENEAYAHAVQLELGELADELKLRLKLKGAARHWSIRQLGVVKFGWDLDNDRPSMRVARPTKILLDPEATIDEDGYTGERAGEHRKLPAYKILAMAAKTPGSEGLQAWIKDKVKDDMATEIGFVEWWTPDYVFWKSGDKVLMKRKNPHWNYEQEEPAPAPERESAPEGQSPVQLDQPAPAPKSAPGLPAVPSLPQEQPAPAPKPAAVNHFATRRIPFIFLSTYNLGKQPMDVTGNIAQNLASQDRINKRNKQIDANADTANSGLVVSLERSGLTQQQATRVTGALRRGGVVAIATGAPQEAVYRPPLQELPAYVYNQLVDTRNRVRDVWGVRGSSPAGIESETTVRGKIITRGLDTDRIGGGISEYLEQFADDAYNWLVQLLYVYDERFLSEFAKGVTPPRVRISVKEGSLLPKDSASIANQAIELANGGKMSLLDLYKRLDYPNPEELAANVWLEENAPEVLYGKDPRVAQVLQQRAAAAQQGEKKPPSESINFKDLPPEGQAQMAKQAGIELHPEAIAAHGAAKEAAKAGPEGVPLPDITPPSP